MESETVSETECIDVANDDLIDVLASLVEYERTNGASGTDERLILAGDGVHKMAMPASTTNVVENGVIYASDLVEDGQIADEIEVERGTATINVL